jgi:hypothetical protein
VTGPQRQGSAALVSRRCCLLHLMPMQILCDDTEAWRVKGVHMFAPSSDAEKSLRLSIRDFFLIAVSLHQSELAWFDASGS